MDDKKLARILLVEDEQDIRTIATMALTQVGGFQVESCASGEDALEKLSDYKPDLILLDFMMPGMDGAETLKAIRSHSEHFAIPVIFMTARAQSQEIAYYKRLGAIDVLVKPFDPMTLSDAIRASWSAHHD